MFDLAWSDKRQYAGESYEQGETVTPEFIPEKITYISDTLWREHCLECAPPQCYKQCVHYQARIDKKCKRTKYGFMPNRSFEGLFPYGIDLRFETWGKIETDFSPSLSLTIPQARKNQAWLNRLSRWILCGSRFFSFLSPTLKPFGAFMHFLSKYRASKISSNQKAWDAFGIEVFSTEEKTINLRLQCDCHETVFSVFKITLEPGFNQFQIQYQQFNIPSDVKKVRLFLTPEGDVKPRLIFTWLDFFKRTDTQENTPADKIKCLAWDLDNTLWKGILSEDGKESLTLNEAAVETIKALNERGIVNTIVSKNTHEVAWEVIESYGLEDLFVYPAINWGQKSENISQIAKAMNLGLDSFGMVDDSEYERREIERLGCVRVYADTDIPTLLSRPEFDVPVTAMSRKRLKTYQESMKRDAIRERFGEDYNAYLESLEIKISILPVETEEVSQRCYELLQRSNQLNLSTRRYTQEAYAQLIASDSMECYAFSSSDVIGDSGIVGFFSFDLSKKPVLHVRDMVISCRVAQKKIEQSVLCEFLRHFQARGFTSVVVSYKRTAKNRPIEMVLQSLPFTETPEDDTVTIFSTDTFDEFNIVFPHEIIWSSNEGNY